MIRFVWKLRGNELVEEIKQAMLDLRNFHQTEFFLSFFLFIALNANEHIDELLQSVDIGGGVGEVVLKYTYSRRDFLLKILDTLSAVSDQKEAFLVKFHKGLWNIFGYIALLVYALWQ
jgi:hypothetical protein